MFLKVSKSGTGKSYLSFVQGYRDEFGKTKHRTLQALGYLDDLKKEFDDPISHFKQVALEYNDTVTNELVIKNLDSKKIESASRKNFGYLFLDAIYKELGLKETLTSLSLQKKIKYDLNDILKLLVYSRVLFPSSKQETYHNKNKFFENFDFSLKDVYRSLDVFASYKEILEEALWLNTKESYQRDTSTVFYDCTNYYFEISLNDEDLLDEEGNILEKGYRKKGPSKENRKDPIIQMGLLMDKNGIPLSYDLFPGNESEKTSLRPILKRTKNSFGLGRVISVADRGINTSDNTVYLAGKNDSDTHSDGYVFGQSILGADKEFKAFVFDQADYQYDQEIDKDGTEFTFKHKSRIFAKEVTMTRDGKRKNKFTVYQKQMVYYSDKYAQRQRKEREVVVSKAKDLIKNPGKYTRATSYGAAKYIQNMKYAKDTGEIANASELIIDFDKIQEEAKFDGYYSIVSSELSISDKELRDIYKGLWEIEETFKITKSNLEARPVFVWTKEHIEAHFLTCFIALVIIRLLEKKLDCSYSVESIIKALRNCNCSNIEHNVYLFDYISEPLEHLGTLYNIDMTKKYRDLSEIKKSFKNS